MSDERNREETRAVQERRAQITKELSELDAKDAVLKAGRTEKILEGLDDQGRFDVLDHLTKWAKARRGHRPDCSCGECD